MMFKGIVFDLDGTLIDSHAITIQAFNHGIVSTGGSAMTATDIMSHYGCGEDQVLEKIVGPEKTQKAYQAYQRYFKDHLHQIQLYLGISELFKLLKTHHIPISIFTARNQITTEALLKQQGLLETFLTVITADQVTHPKPSPEGLCLALSKMQLQPSEVLFVGDSPVDMIASESAKTCGIAALWDSLSNRTELAKYHPWRFASHPSEIWTFLEAGAD